MPDQTQIAGVDGLLGYLKAQEPQVLKTMTYKLLGYALGRTVMLSDQPLVERLTKAGGQATFSELVSEIAMSRQFRYRREKDDAPASPGIRQTSAPAEEKRAAATEGESKSGGE